MGYLKRISVFNVLVVYIIFQFLWWEVLLVRQTNTISDEQQKLIALNTSDATKLKEQIAELTHKKTMRVYMIVGEGTVFLLILLYGIYRVRKGLYRERQITQQQKNFLLSVTHELKTPIAATKLQLQTLQKHELTKEQQHDLLKKAIDETNRLNTLVDNVLLATRVESIDFTLNKETINISELVHKTLHTYFKPYIDADSLTLEIDPEISLSADVVAFPSIIINLVENAIKYSFAQVDVSVKLFKKEGTIVLQVADTGSGISAAEKKTVFEKFYRSGNEDTRKTKGTGLGLYIVNRLVKQHNGTITITDNTPKGTVFLVIFSL